MNRTLGIRGGMALIVVIVIIAATYLYERNASFSGQSAISDLLFQIREQDIRLDRDVERIISFRLPHYDSLVQSGKQLQELITTAKSQQALISRNYPAAFGDGLFRYLDTLKKKRGFIERIQYHVALVRNSFLYLPGLIEACMADDNAPERRDLLNRLVMGVYTHYLFPDKVLIDDVRALMNDIRTHSLGAGNLLQHVEITLGSTEEIEKLKQQMDVMDSDEQFVDLRNLLEEYSLRDDRYSVLLGAMLLLIVLLLLVWLWRTLERLEKARCLAEQSHERLQDAVESLGEAFALFDRDGRLVLHNQTFIKFYPWLKGLLQPGVTLEQIRKWNAPHMTCGSVAGEKPDEDCTGFADSKDPYFIERIGKDRWYLASNRRTKEGGMVSVRTDVSGSKASEKELRKLGRALEQSPASVVITDTEGVIEYVNPKFEQVSGYSAAEVLGKKPSVLKSGETSDEEYREMWRTLKSGQVWQGVFHNKRKDGSMYWEAASISPVRDDDGEISYFIGVKEDITQRRRDEAQILYQANYDLLTNLPNRTLLMERLRQNILGAERDQRVFSLLFIDLDRFKVVNDLYGHVIGDSLMKLVAQRLEQVVREADTVARFGGDEFVVLLSGVAERNEAQAVARKIIEALSRPFELGERMVTIGASIGITLFPADVDATWNREDIASALLSNADMAMYQAKARGRNHCQFFEQPMQESVKRNLALEQDLRHAVAKNELCLYYQPIYESSSNEMTGMEALLRWRHPVLGMISPDRFIPLAEETGLIGAIGEWVFGQACEQMQHWQEKYGVRLNLSVNLSVRQHDQGFGADLLQQILDRTGLSSHYLTLEITENLLMKESDQAVKWLNELKSCGVRLAVDDFGTGYSSLSYLKSFPVDFLKIDRAFVSDLPDDNEDVSLVTAILAMADSLGIQVVAEGVETDEQRRFLREAGCDYMQGYLFSRPLPVVGMEEKLADMAR